MEQQAAPAPQQLTPRKRNCYQLKYANGSTEIVYADGYDVNQFGVLSFGQMRNIHGQMVAMLILTLKPEEWKNVQEVNEFFKPLFEDSGVTIQ